jgi:uncharacterized protein with von Willebrand factor type A (vWA) domain
VDILAQMQERELGRRPSLTDEQREEQEKLLQNFFTNALRLGKLRKELPTAHIHAMCHAVYRWDKKRKFDGNDLLDFHHATAALAYCDVFLTDGPLRALLTSTHVGLDKEMDCAVISDIGEAVKHLNRF